MASSLKLVFLLMARTFLLPLLLLTRAKLIDFETLGHLLSLVPGRMGIGLRRAWYEMSLARCGSNLVVEFLASFRTSRTRVGDNFYLGLGSWVGLADIGDDVMTGNHITVLSGRHQHGFADITRPMRQQHGNAEVVRISSDVWIGSGAIIAADVSRGTVIAAGAVVTRVFPEYSIIGGVPAAQIGNRAPVVNSD